MTEINNNEIMLFADDGSERIVNKVQNLNVIYAKNCLTSSIRIHESVQFRGTLSIALQNGTKVTLNKGCVFEGPNHITSAVSGIVTIGERSVLRGVSILLSNEPNLSCEIGADCLFAPQTVIRASDAHTIFDLDNPNKVLNKPIQGVKIGNHVWVGQGAFICKNVLIPDDCIIGACSLVVAKTFLSHSVIAGNPARTVKTNCSWSSKAISVYEAQLH